ncbi:zinc finger protein [Peziza echinospora]|nr:zinc finger protein [Peziza echinospora]
MCKHILNAQVSIRSPCCRKWFDCAECHRASETHPLQQASEMVFACKKCKKCFRKDTSDWDVDGSDEYCPHCDNHFVIEAKEPKAMLQVEGEDVRVDARMLKDERVKGEKQLRSIFDLEGTENKLC